MKNYKIKITGEGTLAEIKVVIQQLFQDVLYLEDEDILEKGIEWEDNILFTEIKESD